MVRHQISPAFSADRDLFADFFQPFFARTSEPVQRTWSPPAEVTEHDDAFLVTLELPGVPVEAIEITLEGETLLVRGERTRPEMPEGVIGHVDERRSGKFQRSFTFPVSVMGDTVEAKSRDGILGVKVSKRPEVQPRRIQIQRD